MLYGHTKFPFHLFGDMHLPASWSQCNNIPGFIAIVPQYYFKYHCAELMSQGRKKSPEVQDANLFYKLELTLSDHSTESSIGRVAEGRQHFFKEENLRPVLYCMS